MAKFLKFCFSFLAVSAILFGFGREALAGFGISPPYLKNQQLVPGSKYEQTITLLRSSADEDLKATINIKAPEIASWISIDKGEEFILPKGEYQVPMLVTVNVPKDAELGNYKGNLNVRVTAAGTGDKPGVAIALGARVDIDLTLTNVAYADFIVRTAAIPDFEMLRWPWNWWIFSVFLHRVRAVLNVENIGNVATAPSKVTLEVYDLTKTKLLESAEDKSLDKIDAFSTKEITAFFPSKLGPGQYWTKLRVYKDNTITNSYEIAFTIARPGELAKGTPSLGAYPWILAVIYSVILLVVITILIKIKIWSLTASKIAVLFGLMLHPLKLAFRGFGAVKTAFWKWMGRKAREYTDQDKK